MRMATMTTTLTRMTTATTTPTTTMITTTATTATVATTPTAVTTTYEIQVAVETSEDRRNRNETGWSPTLPAHNASSLLFLVESWNTEVAREHYTAETARPDRSTRLRGHPVDHG